MTSERRTMLHVPNRARSHSFLLSLGFKRYPEYLFYDYGADSYHPQRLVVTSEAFRSKMQPARHRMVYTLLKDELAREGGIHALQLRTRTPEEEERSTASAAAKTTMENA